MKILVTGANGMLAKEVKEKFAKENEVIAIRMIAINDLNVAHKDEIIELNLKLNKSKIHSFLIHYFFNDKKMIRTYPNLKQEKLDGTIVYFKDLLPDIKPYYYKFVAKDFYK